MDVRLVSDGEVEERGVDELQKLLEGEHGFVWVDNHRLPSCTARNGAVVSRPLPNVPTAQVALNVATVTARRPLASASISQSATVKVSSCSR
jgi:hypothetical protein